MGLQLYSIVLCAVALPLFAYVQWSRRDSGYHGWVGFWALLLARFALLAAHPPPASIAMRWAGVCAVAATAMLLYSARLLLAAARPGLVGPRWRDALWGASLVPAALTLAPSPWQVAAPYALALLMATTIALLVWAGGWSLRLLAAVIALWGVEVLPRFPQSLPALGALIPSLFIAAMLWVVAERASASGEASAGTTADQLQLFRQSVRRSREFEILTHIGTALSSSLDADALLATIHSQLQKLMDVRNFYVAFQDVELDEIRFAFEVEEGQRMLPRSRPRTNALTEHVIATGQPLIISRDVDAYIRAHGLLRSGRPAHNYLGVPVLLQGQACGVIAVQSHERENAYDTEHLRVLEILAGQAGVALDNARLFAEVQRDAGQKAFLNHIARLTISTLSPGEMLTTVADEIARAFHYDHIALALVSPTNGLGEVAVLEVAAAAGAHADAASTARRIPLGQGLAGKAAQTGEIQALADGPTDLHASPSDWSRCPHACSGLALPIRYAGQTLGVLHLESHTPFGFPPDQILVLQTLTDQIAVALNHATLFQQMQHQAITDSLTGLKTRRFFMEALQAEWRRARAAEANGEPASFCVVLLDLDGFKPLNDNYGHSEGDRVLVRVARLLEQKCRASSVVARFGGDEFIILIPACEPEIAFLFPERLEIALANDPVLAQRQLRGSFGLAVYPNSGATPEELLHRADADMYRAKQLHQHRANSVATPAN
ncbi:MAG TPA: diguanylate cyclase [Terriglobales bacterium]|nr:diguanylate cyclase [Terriglobales bacterium]